MIDRFMRVLDEGGWGVVAIFASMFLTHPLAVAALVTAFASRQSRRACALAYGSLLLSLSAFCTGVVGYLVGLDRISGVLPDVSPSQYATMHAQGLREIRWNLTCGALGTILPGLLATIALLRGAMRAREDGDSHR
jgi:hypothetical protein